MTRNTYYGPRSTRRRKIKYLAADTNEKRKRLTSQPTNDKQKVPDGLKEDEMREWKEKTVVKGRDGNRIRTRETICLRNK